MEPTEEQYVRALDTAEQMLGFRLESFLVPQDAPVRWLAERHHLSPLSGR